MPLATLDIRPFVELGYSDRVDLVRADDIFEIVVGVNWRIVPNVVFKLEGLWFHTPFLDADATPSIFGRFGNMLGLQSQLAVAF